jgi:hypothetical protein
VEFAFVGFNQLTQISNSLLFMDRTPPSTKPVRLSKTKVKYCALLLT